MSFDLVKIHMHTKMKRSNIFLQVLEEGIFINLATISQPTGEQYAEVPLYSRTLIQPWPIKMLYSVDILF